MAEPTILFGATDGIGAITGCELVSDTPSINRDRARALGASGDEVAANLHNERTEYTSTYNIVSDTNDVSTLILGAVVNGRVVTRIAIKTQAGDSYNTLEVTSHNHADNAHADTLKQVAIAGVLGEIAITAYGAVDFMEGTAGDNAGLQSGEITFECQHNDKTGPLGNHLIGENCDAMASADSEWVGVPTTAAVAGWDVTVNENAVSNTEFKTTKVTGTKTAGTMAAPTPG